MKLPAPAKAKAIEPDEPAATPDQLAAVRGLFTQVAKAQDVNAFLAKPSSNGGKP